MARGNCTKRPNGKWRARYRDAAGKEHSRHFDRKVDGQRWLDEVTTSVLTGQYVDPANAKTTVAEWSATWLDGYGSKRVRTVRQARTHIAQIDKAFGSVPLGDVRPSAVKSWCTQLKNDGYSVSYINALHGRLSQIFRDAVYDGITAKNPCSRKTSPGGGKQRPYCATTDQVWALYDAFPAHLRPAILLGAFAGLRTAEACGLRIVDVDFIPRVINPAVQYPAEPLKTETSMTPIPVPSELTAGLSAAIARWGTDWLVTNGAGGQCGPWVIDETMRQVRETIPGLPKAFRFHDLRHYLASLLIASGADVKVVQARLRHASAATTLNTYSHLWPDADESTRAATSAAMADRASSLGFLADSLRTGDGRN
jgi:integrase